MIKNILVAILIIELIIIIINILILIMSSFQSSIYIINLYHQSISSIYIINLYHQSISSIYIINLYHQSISSIYIINLYHHSNHYYTYHSYQYLYQHSYPHTDLNLFPLQVPVFSPIKPAMESLFSFMSEHMPLAAVNAKETLRSEMTRYVLYFL